MKKIMEKSRLRLMKNKMQDLLVSHNGAPSGKKGRKGSKGKVISLNAFLGDDTGTPAGTVRVTKKIPNFNTDSSESDSSVSHQVYQLPTAPRSKQIFDDSSIPHDPPYVAYLSNLPFDINETDISEYFKLCNVINVRLIRENGGTGRFRGFGYIDVNARDDLIQVLSFPNPNIRGRRIEIELSNGIEQQNARKQGGNWRTFDNEARDSNNWRSGNKSTGEDTNWRSGNKCTEATKSVENHNNVAGSWRFGNRSGNISTSKRSPEEEQGNLEERPKLNLKPRTLPVPEIVTTSATPASELNSLELNKSENMMKSKFSGSVASAIFGSAKPINTLAKDLEIEERLTEKMKELKLEKFVNKSTKSNKNWHRRDERHSQANVDDNQENPLEQGKGHQDYHEPADDCEHSESTVASEDSEKKPKKMHTFEDSDEISN
uniref:RRM domain-containing protein n=1 Tax=Glossina austeni TaxID=7395 RepID=A0A1A9VUU4_GLOAU